MDIVPLYTEKILTNLADWNVQNCQHLPEPVPQKSSLLLKGICHLGRKPA